MQKIFKQIASKYMTTEYEIKKEISIALTQAIENSKGNENAGIFWENLSTNGDIPTPDQVIKAIIAKIISDQNI